MNKSELKSRILEVCRQSQLNTIKNLRSEISDAKKMATEIICPVERDDGGYQSQLLAKIDMFEKQLTKATELLGILNKIKTDEPISKVDFGAVVITEKQKLFISAAIGKVKANEDVFYAISPNVPVYKAMQGKKAGETFVFNSIETEILDVF